VKKLAKKLSKKLKKRRQPAPEPVSTYLSEPHHRRRLDWRAPAVLVLIVAVLGAAYLMWGRHADGPRIAPLAIATPTPTPPPKAGDVVGQDVIQPLTATQTAALARQDYGAATLPVSSGITKIIFHYRSQLPTGELITVYGRAYLPEAPKKGLPVFAFAPGTTGIGDECAASLEVPSKANWANYDSHLAMYASQGFAAVTTDYEGMRDPARIHHYMVGELEGRALLDAVRALRNLPETKDRISQKVFLSGYSQGGHAAFWADKIAAGYAPDVKPTGVVGFGPVMSVRQTLVDVVHAANINWFGPYVLYSYRDYYKTDYGSLLLQHWDDTLGTDVPAHCIDTDIPFWGRNPANVYTPEFIQAMQAGDLATNYPVLNRDLELNEVAPTTTATPKRINAGEHDNVVLASQQQAVMPALCSSSKGPVQLVIYPGTTHYDTMLHSLTDTLGWMHALEKGEPGVSTCPQ
jgi:hypothetical protein